MTSTSRARDAIDDRLRDLLRDDHLGVDRDAGVLVQPLRD